MYKKSINPEYKILALISKNNKIKFGINLKFNWKIINNTISHNNKYISIENDSIILSNKSDNWTLDNNYMYNIDKKKYVTFDYEYKIYLTDNEKDARKFVINKNSIFYVKSDFIVNFERINLKNNIKIGKFLNSLKKSKSNFTVGILLAAGTSSRFKSDIPKQLYILDNKPIIAYSIENMINNVDKLLIITNTDCLGKMLDIVKSKKIVILENNVNCRLESLRIGVDYIAKHFFFTKNIIIHDSARPFLTENHFKIDENLLNEFYYLQYFMPLYNGLYSNDIEDFVDRDKYIETCTPIFINFRLCYFILKNYMNLSDRIAWEFTPICKILNIKYKFLKSSYKYLRKITTIDDI